MMVSSSRIVREPERQVNRPLRSGGAITHRKVPMVRKNHVVIFLLAAVSVGLTTTGCDEDKTRGPAARVSVTVRDTGEPLAGIKILAVDPGTNTPLAGPLISDQNGEANFGIAPQDHLRFLVFGGLDWRVHSQTDWYGWRSSVNATAGPTALEPIGDGVARIVMRRGPIEDGLPSLAGRIVDAETGAPLSQAVIGTRPFLTAYNSDTDPGADVTGAAGTFAVHEIVFAQNPETGTVIQLQPLFVSKVGYRTIDWVYPRPLGMTGVNLIDLEIRLTPLSPSDNGRLTGRVLQDGAPAPGVLIGLGGTAADKNGVGFLGFTAVSDSAGHYEFSGLPTGRVVLHPGFPLADQFVPLSLTQTPIYDIGADQTTTALDLIVVTEIVPEIGNDTTFRRTEDDLRLIWSPVPGATSYTIWVNNVQTETTAGNRYEIPVPETAASGWYSWWVLAQADDERVLGQMQRSARFQIVD